MTRRLAALAATALLATALVACSSDDSAPAAPAVPEVTSEATTEAPDAEPSTPAQTETPEAPAAQELDIEVAGDRISPNAADLVLAPGEPLVLRITADRAGELHVHAKPEQYVEFESGSTVQELVIDTPGSVEVEEHESGAVVAVIQVRG